MVIASTSPAWKDEPCLMGIDEAGRGPVLGLCSFCITLHTLHSRLLYWDETGDCFVFWQGLWCMDVHTARSTRRTESPDCNLQVFSPLQHYIMSHMSHCYHGHVFLSFHTPLMHRGVDLYSSVLCLKCKK